MTGYRIAIDTGGTFTDLALAAPTGELHAFKTPSTPNNYADGIIHSLSLAAGGLGLEVRELLQQTRQLLHGTTVATNAIVQGTTAVTGLIVTRGFRDVLLFREGGKPDPYHFHLPTPEPYVPRHLTVEVTERVDAEGNIVRPLEQHDLHTAIRLLRSKGVEAVGVALLWSIENPEHERLVGDFLHREWPEADFTLSHQLNPIIREYRRASSTVIDASLKPLLKRYLSSLEDRLAEHGFEGELGIFSSSGGVVTATEARDKPILTIGSGPAVAPVAALFLSRLEDRHDDLLVVDTGGTSFDVAAVRGGKLLARRDVWIGAEYLGHMTGFRAVDIRSIGSGGGSIADVDSAGLLLVGPASAGAYPGPACYGRGGTRATVTDAAVVLGLVDPDWFLGGRMHLDVERAFAAVDTDVAGPLGLDVREAAAGILEVQTANMVAATEDITINQGFHPKESLLVAGGGAAGLNIVAIARQLEIERVLIPKMAGAFSAFGGLVSEIKGEYSASYFTACSALELDRLTAVLDELRGRATSFLGQINLAPDQARIEYAVEARYPYQVWELEVPFSGRTDDTDVVEEIRTGFHHAHRQIFAVDDPRSDVECVNWIVRIVAPAHEVTVRAASPNGRPVKPSLHRQAFFRDLGEVTLPVFRPGDVPPGLHITGPAIIAEDMTTLVLPPASALEVTASGNYLVEVQV